MPFWAGVVCGKQIEKPDNLTGEFYSGSTGISPVELVINDQPSTRLSDVSRNLVSEVSRKVAAVTRLEFWSLPVFAG